MSKKNIIIGVAVLVVICLGLFFIFSGNDGESVLGGNSLDNSYDSSYEEENIFEDGEIPNVSIRFGNSGEEFIAVMEDNDTAIELVRNITSSGQNLPIYNYDDYDGYEYFQYYDISSSYDIPSNPETVTSEKAGEIYYSEPNRVMLFYRDAEIEGEFTKIGEITNTDGLREAVEDNPVLEGWGNKLIIINYED